jgi:hypothetical protein
MTTTTRRVGAAAAQGAPGAPEEWRAILAARLDRRRADAARRTDMAGYGYMLGELLGAVSRAGLDPEGAPARAEVAVAAMLRAALLDMDLAKSGCRTR